jgi:hypothetical protein
MPRPAHCLIPVTLLLVGCASLQPPDFAGAEPELDPVAYFEGPTVSWGVFENAGRPTRRFDGDRVGHREGDALVLMQRIRFDDGRTQQRRWRLWRVGPHEFHATAPGVIGIARGEAYGNAFRWDYVLQVDPDNRLTRVRMQHWMYLAGDRSTLVNRVVVRKFGIRIAEVTEYFQRGAVPVPGIGRSDPGSDPPGA